MGFSNNTGNVEGAGPSAEGAARFVFNGSAAATDGRPTKLTTAQRAIHKVPDFSIDEIYLWASNYSSANTTLDIYFAEETGEDQTLRVTVQSREGLVLVLPGLPLGGGHTIYALAGSNDSVKILGFAHRRYRIDPQDSNSGYDGSS